MFELVRPSVRPVSLNYFHLLNLYFLFNLTRTYINIYFLQVFHSLLKAHAVEARVVVRQALEILTPAMPGRMEDGNVRQISKF